MNSHWTDDFFSQKFGKVIASRDPELTRRQVDFIIEKSQISPSARVLDICCGHGRHSLELARRGYSVAGIDLFGIYLDEARKAAAQENLSVEFIEMDIRKLRFDRKFDLAINMWTSFGFFDEETNVSIIRAMREVLVDGGKLILELINRDWVIRSFRRRDWWPADEDLIVIEERSIDLSSSIVSSVWQFLQDGRIEEKPMQLRLYSCHELIALLRSSGFGQVEAFGDLEGGPVTLESRMMRIVATAS